MLSDELIARIGNSLDAMPPKPSSRRELDLLVTRIEAKIRGAQERGATYAEIAKQISENGYPIKTSTLRLALQRHRREGPGMNRAVRRGSVNRTIKSNVSEMPASGGAASAQAKRTKQT